MDLGDCASRDLHAYFASQSADADDVGLLSPFVMAVTQFIHEANQHYQLLTLRIDTPAADKFYQKLGFKTHPRWEHTTHHLQLSEMEYYPLSVH